jgi:hypothetical protein
VSVAGRTSGIRGQYQRTCKRIDDENYRQLAAWEAADSVRRADHARVCASIIACPNRRRTESPAATRLSCSEVLRNPDGNASSDEGMGHHRAGWNRQRSATHVLDREGGRVRRKPARKMNAPAAGSVPVAVAALTEKETRSRLEKKTGSRLVLCHSLIDGSLTSALARFMRHNPQTQPDFLAGTKH